MKVICSSNSRFQSISHLFFFLALAICIFAILIRNQKLLQLNVIEIDYFVPISWKISIDQYLSTQNLVFDYMRIISFVKFTVSFIFLYSFLREVLKKGRKHFPINVINNCAFFSSLIAVIHPSQLLLLFQSKRVYITFGVMLSLFLIRRKNIFEKYTWKSIVLYIFLSVPSIAMAWQSIFSLNEVNEARKNIEFSVGIVGLIWLSFLSSQFQFHLSYTSFSLISALELLGLRLFIHWNGNFNLAIGNVVRSLFCMIEYGDLRLMEFLLHGFNR
jgi:hypothetical protein